MTSVAGMGSSFVMGTVVQAQHPKTEWYSALIWVKLGQVGVRIVGSGQVVEERMEEDFVDRLGKVHGCKRVGSRSWARRAETAVVVKGSEL